MEWHTTTTLLSGLRDPANHTAWARFEERFRLPLLAFARRSGLDDHAAEDAVQDALAAFVQAFRDGRYDRAKGRLGHWLFGIAANHVRRVRRAQGRVEAGQRDAAFWADQPTPGDELAPLWESVLWEACAGLARGRFDPTTFRAFERIVRDGCTPAEAAAELGLTVKAVYNAKHRVLSRIRALRADLDAPL